MAIKSISSNICTTPGTVTVSGVSDPHDSIYMCIEGTGQFLGGVMADSQGYFTIKGSYTSGSHNVCLTDVRGGGGQWTTPLTVNIA